MPRRVEFTARAARKLRKLDRPTAAGMLVKIRALADEPFPAGSKALKHVQGAHRIRVGVWRIIYAVGPGSVLVAKVAKRSDAYRRLLEEIGTDLDTE